MKKILLSIAAACAPLSLSSQAAEWSNSFDLGATVTKGNSDSVLLTSGITSELKQTSDEYLINMFYTYGESGGTSTNDEIIANAAWKHLLGEKLYSGARFDYLRDQIADIGYRASLTALVGQYLVKSDTTSLALEGGLGYTFEEQGGLNDNYANLYIGEIFEHKLNDKTKIYQSFRISSPIDNFDNYNFIAEAGLETTLTDSVSLKVSIQNKYDAIPAAGLDSNDFRLITGISYKF